MARLAVLIKVGVSCLGGVLEREALDPFLQHPLDVGRHFPYEHFFAYLVDRDIFCLVEEKCGVLRRFAAIAFEAVEDNGYSLLLCGAVFGSEVGEEKVPVVGGGFTPEKIVDLWVEVYWKFCLQEGEFLTGSCDESAKAFSTRRIQ